MPDSDVLSVVEELRRFLAWPTPNVAAASPRLRALARSRGAPAAGTGARSSHAAVLWLLTGGVDRVGRSRLSVPGAGSVEIEGPRAARAYRFLFWLGRTDSRPSHEQRRGLALAELGLDMTVDYWRREGPETDFLTLLARGLLEDEGLGDEPRYVLQSLASTYFFDAEGLLTRHEQVAQLRALVRQEPHSRLEMLADWYAGHRFTLVALTGCEPDPSEGPVSTDLPLRVLARGPAVRPGDVIDIAAVFAVDAQMRIGQVAWTSEATAERASLRLRFDPSAGPARVSWFKNARTVEAGVLRAQTNSPVEGTHGGDFYRDFDGLLPDRWFGLHWRWAGTGEDDRHRPAY